ncbi:hypothetical protein [Methanoculleus sp.]|uniref:hypothetical protein n=1 Tax=Methanoculleus sp. TaxID=90427 RepID=UPI00260CA6BE|nr:hypothetical protein [Methanoculleus sp.]MCK9307114.1 hypothetical protein [Methanoculleus sp.]MDD2788570.1 hypothetical protein [Methanoculleus sp.]MDD3217472.1 hypothetical protein [Methanoculleus sp.]
MKTLPAFITTLTYLFLAGVAVLYVAVFAPNGAHAPDPKPFGFLQLRPFSPSHPAASRSSPAEPPPASSPTPSRW